MAQVMSSSEVTLEVINGLLQDIAEKVNELGADPERNIGELEDIQRQLSNITMPSR